MDWWIDFTVPWSTGSTKFIKHCPLNSGSRFQILWSEVLCYDPISIVEYEMDDQDSTRQNVFYDLIWTVGARMDGWQWFFFNLMTRWGTEPMPTIADPWESSCSCSGGRKRARFIPMWPMRRGATILLTLRWWWSAVVAGDGVIPHSEIAGTKPAYVCPGCSNHTYSNNMTIRFNVQ
jgi:hypothetical protein